MPKRFSLFGRLQSTSISVPGFDIPLQAASQRIRLTLSRWSDQRSIDPGAHDDRLQASSFRIIGKGMNELHEVELPQSRRYSQL